MVTESKLYWKEVQSKGKEKRTEILFKMEGEEKSMALSCNLQIDRLPLEDPPCSLVGTALPISAV